MSIKELTATVKPGETSSVRTVSVMTMDVTTM